MRGSPCSTQPWSTFSSGWLFARRHFRRVAPSPARVRVLDPRQRSLALDDPERAFATLFANELVERPRLADVRGHVRRERRGHLALLRQTNRELRLLDGRDDALRLRH